MDWLETKKKKIADEILRRSETHEDTDGLDGVYKSFSKVWKDVGGNEAAFISSQNLMASCYKAWHEGGAERSDRT